MAATIDVPTLEYKGHFVTGKNVLITGSTAGIGEALVYLVADLKPNKIFLACRCEHKGKAVMDKLAERGVNSQILVGDLGTKAGTKKIADDMLATKEPLHIFVSNAGVWKAFSKVKVMSDEPGLETHFMTNFLSMVMLCSELKPLLEQNVPSRIIITGSAAHMIIAKGIANLDNLQFENGKVTKHLPNDLAYGHSNLLKFMWAKQFAKTVCDGLSVMVYEPGQVITNIEWVQYFQKNYRCLNAMLLCFKHYRVCCMPILREPEEAARIALWCADSPDGASANGKYIDFGQNGPLKMHPPCELHYSPRHKKYVPSVMDDSQVQRLWDETRELQR